MISSNQGMADFFGYFGVALIIIATLSIIPIYALYGPDKVIWSGYLFFSGVGLILIAAIVQG